MESASGGRSSCQSWMLASCEKLPTCRKPVNGAICLNELDSTLPQSLIQALTSLIPAAGALPAAPTHCLTSYTLNDPFQERPLVSLAPGSKFAPIHSARYTESLLTTST